jgi:glutamate/tyrosine decarboxylase-like PLP-dependent enzyme
MVYGKSGIATNIAKNIHQAQKVANWIEASTSYELVKKCDLNVVLFKPKEGVLHFDSNECMRRLNQTGQVFLSPGSWQGQPIIRAALSNWSTTDEDVEKVINALQLVSDSEI